VEITAVSPACRPSQRGQRSRCARKSPGEPCRTCLPGSLADLFQETNGFDEVMEILKLREIYRHLSNAADRGDQPPTPSAILSSNGLATTEFFRLVFARQAPQLHTYFTPLDLGDTSFWRTFPAPSRTASRSTHRSSDTSRRRYAWRSGLQADISANIPVALRPGKSWSVRLN